MFHKTNSESASGWVFSGLLLPAGGGGCGPFVLAIIKDFGYCSSRRGHSAPSWLLATFWTNDPFYIEGFRLHNADCHCCINICTRFSVSIQWNTCGTSRCRSNNSVSFRCRFIICVPLLVTCISFWNWNLIYQLLNQSIRGNEYY